MKLRLIRHSTLWLEYGGLRILVDPMFSTEGTNPPVARTANERRNPLVPIPDTVDMKELVTADLVLVTHLHLDHWDPAANAALPKHVTLLCQPGNERQLRADGRSGVIAVEAEWRPGGHSWSIPGSGITVSRTGGRHGTCLIGKAMGPVSGFVLSALGEPTVYIAGDTIYCTEVEEALKRYQPDVVVVNAGGARFRTGDPITMTAEDIAAVCGTVPTADIAAVHLEAINHCLETRQMLRERLAEYGLAHKVRIPTDGEWL